MEAIDFNHLYVMYSKRLQHIAFSVTRDRFLAEDVVQETFIKAFKKIDTIDDSKKIASWLSAIAVRTAIDFLRVEKRNSWILADQLIIENVFFYSGKGPNTEKEVELKLFKEELNQSLLQLSEEYKEVLNLRIQYELKEKEIACKLQLPASTIKNRLYRGRKRLIEVLSNKYTA